MLITTIQHILEVLVSALKRNEKQKEI
jgi:hypothetical protein